MNQLLLDIREMVREQSDYRELLGQIVRRDLALRYKQTVMGVGWALFMPLLNTAVFSVIFTRVAPIDVGMPYPVFAFCGLAVWNSFASAQRFAVTSLTGNPNLVTKVYFPREIFPFSSVFVCMVDFAVSALVLIPLMMYYGVPLSPLIVFLPAVVVVHVAFSAAVALLISMANLFYRDVKYLFEVVMSIWMFASSVLYPVSLIEGRLGNVLRLNPMTHIIDAYRTVLFGVGAGEFAGFAVTAGIAAILLLTAWLLFHRSEFEFAENI
jgi:lipopolysaccharide transport system permease protein